MIKNTVLSVLLCVCSVDIGSSESFLHGGELPTLIVQSSGHALHVFVNGQLSGRQSITLFSRLYTSYEISLFHVKAKFGCRANYVV